MTTKILTAAELDAVLSKIKTVDELLAMDFPEPRWAVDGLIVEGATILGGRPKSGKSWLSHHLGLSVATGQPFLAHFLPKKGSVLYLALEDSIRRLKSRSRKIMAGMGIASSAGMCTVNEWPRADQGGVQAIERWLDEHQDARLVMIDTLAKARRMVMGRKGTPYQDDYEAMEDFQRIGLQRNISVLVIHHTRKPVRGLIVELYLRENGTIRDPRPNDWYDRMVRRMG